MVPQGTLAERIRAAGAGIGGVLHRRPAPAPSWRGQGDARDRRPHLRAGDAAAWRLRAGRGVARRTAGATSPTARRRATSVRSWRWPAKLTIVQAQHMVELGELDPENVVTPGIFVDRVLHVPLRRPDRLLTGTQRCADDRRDRHEAADPRRNGRARRARHPRRLVRQPRHRHADRWSPTTCRWNAR